MEFVEGDTLSKLIAQGPIALHEALAYAVQIVNAPAAAHAKAQRLTGDPVPVSPIS